MDEVNDPERVRRDYGPITEGDLCLEDGFFVDVSALHDLAEDILLDKPKKRTLESYLRQCIKDVGFNEDASTRDIKGNFNDTEKGRAFKLLTLRFTRVPDWRNNCFMASKKFPPTSHSGGAHATRGGARTDA